MQSSDRIGGNRVFRALDQRLGLRSLNYEVPEHANGVLYTLGGVTVVGLLLLILSGIYLAQFYNPDPAQARLSVLSIMTSAPFGSFVRSFHFWLANLVTITLALHMARVFVSGSYRAPREANWLVGTLLLFVVLGFVFTGTVMKWDQEGYEALGHNREVGVLLGGAGAWFTTSFSRSVPLLTRVYFAHIAILPAILTVLVGVHLLLIKHHGISSLPGHDRAAGAALTDTQLAIREEGASHFGRHAELMTGLGLLLAALAGALALVALAPLGHAIVQGEEVTKPLWMFLVLYPLENAFGIRALIWVPIVAGVLLALVPFVDRSRSSALGSRRWVLIAGALFAVAYVALVIAGIFAPHGKHLM